MLSIRAECGICRDGYLCLGLLLYWLFGSIILSYKLSRTKSDRIRHVTHKGVS